jgi:type II secretory pathway component PulM
MTLAASGTVALVGMLLSSVLIWLVITQPITIAGAVTPNALETVRALGAAVWDVLRQLLALL